MSESALEKALTELVAAKIVERCQEDRLSVAFFRNRRHESLNQQRNLRNMSYTFHKCGECGCGKFLQNPLGPRNPSSGVAFIGAAHGLSLLGRSQLETYGKVPRTSQRPRRRRRRRILNGSQYFSKKVTIGKTTEIDLPFNARRTTLLGAPCVDDMKKLHRSLLANVKLKLQSAKMEDNNRTLLEYKMKLVHKVEEIPPSPPPPSPPPLATTTASYYTGCHLEISDQDSGTGSGVCSEEDSDCSSPKTPEPSKKRRATSESNVFTNSSSSDNNKSSPAADDSDIGSMTSVDLSNMQKV
eukprot:sb/3467444/